MTHAFRTAGGQSVVSCLWEATTSQLAVIHKEMYAYLVNRKTLAEAVQLAQKDYLASERPEMTRHPYYWAHLVVNGYSGAFEFRD